MADTNGNGNIRQVSVPIAVGVMALLLGVGGTVFYFGGSLRQIDVNTANIARLDPVGNSLLAMKTEFENQKRAYDQLAEDVRKLPIADSDFRARQAEMRAQVAGLQMEIAAIQREFRPREYWETRSAEISAIKLQVGELATVRDHGIQEWNQLIQRVASLEAHHNDLMARMQLLAGDVRDELNFYRNTAARRIEAPLVK